MFNEKHPTSYLTSWPDDISSTPLSTQNHPVSRTPTPSTLPGTTSWKSTGAMRLETWTVTRWSLSTTTRSSRTRRWRARRTTACSAPWSPGGFIQSLSAPGAESTSPVFLLTGERVSLLTTVCESVSVATDRRMCESINYSLCLLLLTGECVSLLTSVCVCW